MHDVHAAIAGLSAAKANAIAFKKVNPSGAKLGDYLKPLDTAPAAAQAGALLDQFVWHAGDSESEMILLRRVDKIWQRLSTAAVALRGARTALEAGIADPSNSTKANEAIAAAAGLRDELLPQMKVIGQDVASFAEDLGSTDFLPEHAQAQDKPLASGWSSSDLFAGRRTGALRAALLASGAAAGEEGRAFALGALSAYTTRVTVGAYRNAVVGGPPRNHRYRSRVAARTVGAWLRKHRPADTQPLDELAKVLRGKVGDDLPIAIAGAFAKAWEEAFASFLTAPAPDIRHGYAVLLEQLDILSRLTLAGPTGTSVPGSAGSGFPAPVPVSAAVTVKLPANTGPGTVTQGGAGGWGGNTPAGGGVGPVGKPKKKKKFSWKVALAAVVIIALGVVGALTAGPPGAAGGILAGAAFAVAIGAHKEADGIEVGVGATGTYEAALTSPDAAQLCQELFLLDVQLFTLATTLLQALKTVGLAYPDAFDLESYPFAQFTKVAAADQSIRKPMADPLDFLSFPTSPIELPSTGDGPFTNGSDPGGAIDAPPTERWTAADLTVDHWVSEVLQKGARLHRGNYQLDADRQPGMRCWQGKTKSEPVQITPLVFDAV